MLETMAGFSFFTECKNKISEDDDERLILSFIQSSNIISTVKVSVTVLVTFFVMTSVTGINT